LGEIERVQSSAQEAERDIASSGDEASDTERRIQEAQAEGARKEEELESEVALKSGIETALQGARERFGAVKGSSDDLETQTRELRREHHEITERLHRAELERAESESEMRVLLERVRNEYEVDLRTWTPQAFAAPEALAEIEDADLEGDEGHVPDEAIVTRPMTQSLGAPVTREERRERLKVVQEKLRSLGPVNLLAMQDYEERRQRLSFLSNQWKDLDEARVGLLEAIEKINRTAAELFQKTFVQVNENFQRVF